MTNKEEDKTKPIQKYLAKRVEDEAPLSPLKIVQPKRWGLLIGVLLIIAAVGIWSFVGRIPIEVTGKCVAFNPMGIFVVQTKASGTIQQIVPQEGDIVAKGDLIATVYNPHLRALLRQILMNEFKIKNLQSDLATLKSTLTTREALLKEGLIAKKFVEDSKTLVSDKEIAIEEARSALVGAFTDLEKISSYWPEEFNKNGLQIKPENLIEIENQLSKVTAPQDGLVLEVLVSVGDIVDEKAPLVWLEYPSVNKEGIIFYATVPAEAGDKVRIGQEAHIEPFLANPQEYGSIIGFVTSISPYLASETELYNNLRNKQLVSYLTEGSQPVRLVIIEPKKDLSTASGVAWTSQNGPPFSISTGSIGKVKITVEEQPPISFLIPTWKLKPSL